MDESVEDGRPPVRRQIRGWHHPRRRGLQAAAAVALAVWLLALEAVAYLRWAADDLARHLARH